MQGFLFISILFLASVSHANFTYEGYLTEQDLPVSGSREFQARILGEQSGLCELYVETRQVTVEAGHFRWIVGSPGALSSSFASGLSFRMIFGSQPMSGNNCSFDPRVGGSKRLLEIHVEGVSLGTVELSEAPRALVSSSTDSLMTYPLSPVAPQSGDLLRWNQGNSMWEPSPESLTNWMSLSGKPSVFPPESHRHSYADLDSGAGTYLLYSPNGVSCSTGQVLKWRNARWECGDDEQGSLPAGNVTGQFLRWTGTSWSPSLDGSAFTGIQAPNLTGILPVASLPPFTGDVTSTAGSSSLLLASTGVTAGTYQSVTVDPKGRVTGGTNPTTLAGHGIGDGVVNAGSVPSLQSGADISKSAPGISGRLYIAHDSRRIFRDNGTAWDQITSNNAGTVTSIEAGPGLTGGPITSSGTLALANGGVGTLQLADSSVTGAKVADGSIGTADLAAGAVTDAKVSAVGVGKIVSHSGGYFEYRPDNIACSTGQLLKWNGSAWICAADLGAGALVYTCPSGLTKVDGDPLQGLTPFCITNSEFANFTTQTSAQVFCSNSHWGEICSLNELNRACRETNVSFAGNSIYSSSITSDANGQIAYLWSSCTAGRTPSISSMPMSEWTTSRPIRCCRR